MKLNLYISTSGYCSRRKSTLLIKDGKVKVCNKVVTEPWFNVEDGFPVQVEGKPIKEKGKVCLLFNKPKGVTATLSDRFAERKITDFIPKAIGRVYPVGRLDKLSRGLMILTNDGDLCYRLSHPKFEIEKEYEVLVEGHLDDSICKALENGMQSEEDFLKVKSARIEKAGQDRSTIRVIVCEGKKRHLRRLFKSLGFEVLDLKRIRIGPFKLGDLKEGSFKKIIKYTAAVLVLSCCFISGCAGLMFEERERKLDEAFQEGKISKIQYLSSKSALEQEKTGGKKIINYAVIKEKPE